MNEKEKDILEKVIKLSKERAYIIDSLDSQNGEPIGGGIYSLDKIELRSEEQAANQKLWDYLLSLSDEELLMVGTMMLVGRDGDRGGNMERMEMYRTNERIFRGIMSERDGAINYLTGKKPLGEYLEEGMRECHGLPYKKQHPRD